MIENVKRNKELVKLRESGMSYRELGRFFKIDHTVAEDIYKNHAHKYSKNIKQKANK